MGQRTGRNSLWFSAGLPPCTRTTAGASPVAGTSASEALNSKPASAASVAASTVAACRDLNSMPNLVATCGHSKPLWCHTGPLTTADDTAAAQASVPGSRCCASPDRSSHLCSPMSNVFSTTKLPGVMRADCAAAVPSRHPRAGEGTTRAPVKCCTTSDMASSKSTTLVVLPSDAAVGGVHRQS